MTDYALHSALRGSSRDDLLELANDVLARIYDEFSRACTELDHAYLESRPTADVSLANGWPGRALCLAMGCEAGFGKRYGSAALELAEIQLEVLVERCDSPWLFSGGCGVLYSYHQIVRALKEQDRHSDVTNSFVMLLIGLLQGDATLAQFDLIRGAAGVGLFALEVAQETARRDLLTAVVANLEATAEQSRDGCTWHTGPELLHATLRAQDPEGYFDLGMAHGTAGVLGILAEITRRYPTLHSAITLRDETSRWLAQQVIGHKDRNPPAVLAPLRPRLAAARTAWCYGNPGVALGLYKAATAASDDSLARLAIEAAVASTDRNLEESGVVGPSLCHGSAGVALTLHSLAAASRNERLLEGAARWAEVVTRTWRSIGLTRLVAAERPSADRDVGGDPLGVLTGLGGVALAALTLAGSIGHGWDAFMLTNPASPSIS